jgi:hypothetical protein
MNTKLFAPVKAWVLMALTTILLLPGCLQSGWAQNPPISLPPGVQAVVRLVRGGLSEDVVLAQIKSTGAYYSLSVDQILYLHDQGVSQNVRGHDDHFRGHVEPERRPAHEEKKDRRDR